MSHANKKQIEIMTDFMEKHSWLAKSFSEKGNNYKDSHKILWEKLTKALNRNGPPTKTTQEWRRIWTTRKYNVKKKLTLNKNLLSKTGGGPFVEIPLDNNEETIAKTCGIEAAVAGISGVSSYGCGEEDLELEIAKLLSEAEQLLPATQEENVDTADTVEMIEAPAPSNKDKKLPESQPNKKGLDETVLLARKQLELQEKFLKVQEGIENSIKGMNDSIIELKDCIKSLCIEKENDRKVNVALKKEELKLKRMEIELAQAVNNLKIKELQK